MRKTGWAIVAAVGIGAFLLAWGSGARAAESAKEQITTIEHKIIDATNADQVMKYYDKSDIDLYDFVPPLQYKGETAVHQDLDNFFNNAKDVQGKFVELHVITDGKIGVAYSIQHFTWKDKDGKAQEATLRVDDDYRKIDGEWKLFHSQVSVPVDPKTGQAQMNLSS